MAYRLHVYQCCDYTKYRGCSLFQSIPHHEAISRSIWEIFEASYYVNAAGGKAAPQHPRAWKHSSQWHTACPASHARTLACLGQVHRHCCLGLNWALIMLMLITWVSGVLRRTWHVAILMPPQLAWSLCKGPSEEDHVCSNLCNTVVR